MISPGALKKRITKYDITALSVCAGLFLVFAISARFGIGLIDEHWYFTIPQRILQGGKLFVEEWHVTQLTGLVQLPPYALFVKLTGGTDGILLFMRILYAAVNSAFCLFYYIRFREKKLTAVAAAAIFCAFAQYGIRTMCYYTLGAHFLTSACVLLCTGKKAFSKPDAVAAGVFLSGAVLCEPALAAVYILYTILVLLRHRAKKRKKDLAGAYDFVLGGRKWKYLTGAVVLCAVCVTVPIAVHSGVGRMLENLPELFTDSQYQLAAGGNEGNLEKLGMLFTDFGIVPFAGLCVLVPAAAAARRFAQKKDLRGAVLVLSLLLLISCYVYSFVSFIKKEDSNAYVRFTGCYTVPQIAFGLICHLLTKKRDPRFSVLLFAGTVGSLCADFTSHLSMGFGGRIALFATVFNLPRLIGELKTDADAKTEETSDRPPRRIMAALRAVALLLTAAFLVCDAGCLVAAALHRGNDRVFSAGKKEPIDETIAFGPLKGVVTTGSYRKKHEAVLGDLSVLRDAEPGPFFTTELDPAQYLYLDALPIGTYSPWIIDGLDEARLERYWKLNPQMRPKYVYTETKELTKERIDFFKRLCDFEIRSGSAGYILTVKEWFDG